MSDEFSLIEKYFAPLSDKIGDDCAVIDIPDGMRLVTSVDTLVENTHFYLDAPPNQIGYRAVVTALSDLAAMGAQPIAVTLALTLPEGDDTWLHQFSLGLAEALDSEKVELIGGDTTQGPLTITVQVFGVVPPNKMLTRQGAKVGDKIYVSGPLGDAAAALTVMNGDWPGAREYREYLLTRFYRPTPRIDLGLQLLDIASAAIDISDGLLADAAHIGKASGVKLDIDTSKVPLSPALQTVKDHEQAKQWALTGGDDYELLFTVPANNADKVPEGCVCVGEVVEGASDQGSGWKHFSV
jgi:thiamine-monophosphate kinase